MNIPSFNDLDTRLVPWDKVEVLLQNGRNRAAAALVRRYARQRYEPVPVESKPVPDSVVEAWHRNVTFRNVNVGAIPAHV